MAIQSNILLRQKLWKARKTTKTAGAPIVLNTHSRAINYTMKEELHSSLVTDDSQETDFEIVTVIVANDEQNDDEAINCILEAPEEIRSDAAKEAHRMDDDEPIPKVALKKHKRRSAGEKDATSLTCEECGKVLSNPASFRYHMQLHSDETPFLCTECGEGFKTRNAYDGHMTTHSATHPNKCDVCGKAYRQPASLRSHMLSHSGEKVRCAGNVA